jgi:hypothetical protein
MVVEFIINFQQFFENHYPLIMNKNVMQLFNYVDLHSSLGGVISYSERGLHYFPEFLNCSNDGIKSPYTYKIYINQY